MLKKLSTLIIIVTIFSSCNSELEPVNLGVDKCSFCHMVIIDARYSTSVLAPGGQTFKFDDLECMLKYSGIYLRDVTDFYVSIYDRPYEPMIKCSDAYFLKDEIFPSPMNSGYAAFSEEANTRKIADSLHIKILTWEEIKINELKRETTTDIEK
jgi:copper chaperone NosL